MRIIREHKGFAPIVLILAVVIAGLAIWGGVHLYQVTHTTATISSPSTTNTSSTSASSTTTSSTAPIISSSNPAVVGKISVIAIINQSGSTNTLGYEAIISSDGSASILVQNATTSITFAAGTVDAATLQNELSAIGDVTTLRQGQCAKSASFGTTTTVTYKGKTSGDLQCQQIGTAGVNLAATVRGIETALNIPTARHIATP